MCCPPRPASAGLLAACTQWADAHAGPAEALVRPDSSDTPVVAVAPTPNPARAGSRFPVNEG